jgi:hypothetical protein
MYAYTIYMFWDDKRQTIVNVSNVSIFNDMVKCVSFVCYLQHTASASNDKMLSMTM